MTAVAATPTRASSGGPARDDAAPKPDAQLAVAAAGGCEWSFATLVDRYKNRVFGLVRQRCPDAQTAEDLTQETFLSAWKSLGRYDPGRPFETWLFTIAVRRAASLARRRQVRIAVESAGPLSGAEPGADTNNHGQQEAGAELWGLAARVLSPAANTILWLVYAEGLTPMEVGRVLGRPAVAVRVQLHRARKRLAEAAEAEAGRADGDATRRETPGADPANSLAETRP